MSDLQFFTSRAPIALSEIAASVAATLPPDAHAGQLFTGVLPLDRAGLSDISLFTDDDAVEELQATRAGACFVLPAIAARVPSRTIALVVPEPREAFRRIAVLMYPGSVVPGLPLGRSGIDATANIHRDARLEDHVVVDAGAIIGPGAEIGAGTVIGAHCVIGPRVRIGRFCAIDAHVVIGHALIGDRVAVHAGARIGPASVSEVRSSRDRVPSLGRVILQDDVEIGANAVVERGRLGDTVIGEGSSIESLVAISAGASIARYTVTGRAAAAVSPVLKMV